MNSELLEFAVRFGLWIVGLCLVMLALVDCVLFLRYKKQYSGALTTFPSSPTLPIMGSLHLVFGSSQSKRVEKILKLFKTVKVPTVFWFSYIPTIFLSKSEDILQVTNKNQDRYTFGIMERVLKDGILLAKGEQWRNVRRIMNPAFSIPMLKQYQKVFNEHSQILVKRLSKKANTGMVFDLWEYIRDMNFDASTQNMMGYKARTQETGDTELYEAGSHAVMVECKRFSNVILFFNVFSKIYLYLSGNENVYKKLEELPNRVTKERLRKLERQHQLNAQNLEEKPQTALIDFLLKAHMEHPAEFDEQRISTEMSNTVIAGSDTTATTLCFVCLFLAMHPGVQDKVYEEIRQVFKDEFVDVSMEHSNNLKYMEQCIKETLRKFTAIPITVRQSPEPIQLNDKQIIPANFNVAFLFEAVHKDPTVYPNPERFDPDRFSSENNAKNVNNFMGFGVGHRSCIGQKYAMLSMKTQLVYLLREYKFTTDMQMSDLVYTMDLVVRSEKGYPVKIWKRN